MSMVMLGQDEDLDEEEIDDVHYQVGGEGFRRRGVQGGGGFRRGGAKPGLEQPITLLSAPLSLPLPHTLSLLLTPR
jgi:hypothetical protein